MPDSSLPLPQKVWFSWDDHPAELEAGRSVELRSPVFEARPAGRWTLYVACSGDFSACLDGDPIEFEPRSAPPFWEMRTADLTGRLHGDTHRLSFRAEPDSGVPFLLCCLDGHDEEGGIVKREASRQAFEASLDGGETWEPAFAFEGPWSESYGFPGDSPDDFARLSHGRQLILGRRFAAIEEAHNGLGSWEQAQLGSPLRVRTPITRMNRPGIDWARLNRTMFHLMREDYARQLNEWIEQFTERSPWITLRAEGELFGRLVLRNAGGGPVVLAVTCGESPGELDKYNRRMSELYELAPGERTTTFLIGFRYARLTVLAAEEGEAVLDPPVIQELQDPAPQTGTFECSDELLNRIFALSARTVQICSQNELWDGAKRDLLPWMGDLHLENLIYYHTFGDPFVPRLSLQANRETGPALARPYRERVIPSLSRTWGNNQTDINGIPSYSAWWVVGLWDYLLYTGDREYLRFEAESLAALLAHLARGVTEDGAWSYERYGCPTDYVDWSVLLPEERRLTMQALVAAAFRCGGRCLMALGDGGAAEEYERLSSKVLRYHIAQSGRPDFTQRHQPNVLPIAFALLEGGAAERQFDRSIAVPSPRQQTLWWRGYDLLAAAALGRTQWALDYIRQHWGALAREGETSLWECIDASWLETDDPHAASATTEEGGYGGYRTSLCHGWAGGPAVWMHRAILGVQPVAPGFERFAFGPDLGELEWARGTVPTPEGPITVELRREGERVTTRLDAPEGLVRADEGPAAFRGEA